MVVVADADQIDVAFAVDLATGEKELVDAALAGAVEQFARAVGEKSMGAAAEQRDVRLAAAALARQQSRRCRYRRRGADGDVAHIADQPADHVGEQFLVAEGFFRRRAAHARTVAGSRQNLRAWRRAGHIRSYARRRCRNDRAAAAARRRAA